MVDYKKNVVEYDNFLSEKLLATSIMCANNAIESNDYDYTNHDSWDDEIINNGNKIYVKIIQKDSDLYNKLTYEIENNLKIPCRGIKLMFHFMGLNCNVGQHNDGHVDYALTIYLNDLREEDGGIFNYYIDNNIYKINPQKNKGVFIKKTEHSVSEIKTTNQYRVTIQGFYSDDLMYKNEKINILLY
jgi:hypothetical protein